MIDRKPYSVVLPLVMFAVAAGFYLYEFLLRVSPNVLEKELFSAFGMDAKAFGFFSSAYYWAYAPLQLPVGALTDKYGPRRLLTFAIFLCGLSTLALAYTPQFSVACIARFFIGVGSAFAFISCIKIVNIWFHPKWFPVMTGLTLTIGTLGAAVGGTPLSLALRVLSWRELLIYLGWAGLLLALLAWLLIRDHNPYHVEHSLREKNDPGFWTCLKTVAKLPQSWIVGIYAFFVTAPTDAFGGTWGVKFLVEVHGISRDAASVAAVTMTFVGMAVGSPLIGWISQKWDQRKIPMALSACIAAIALTLIIYSPHLSALSASVLFFLFGAAGTYVLAFVMTKRFTGSIYVATAVGFVNMISMFGSAGLTYAIGWLLYTVEDYQVSLAVLPLFYIISALVVVPFIRDRRKVS